METLYKLTIALELPAAPTSPPPLCTTAEENSEVAIVSVLLLELAVACLTHAYSPVFKSGIVSVQLLRVPPVIAPVANV